jgi:hypothetical protein
MAHIPQDTPHLVIVSARNRFVIGANGTDFDSVYELLYDTYEPPVVINRFECLYGERYGDFLARITIDQDMGTIECITVVTAHSV